MSFSLFHFSVQVTDETVTTHIENSVYTIVILFFMMSG